MRKLNPIVDVLGRAAALWERAFAGWIFGMQVLRAALACAGRFQKGGTARSPGKAGAPQSPRLSLGTAQGERAVGLLHRYCTSRWNVGWGDDKVKLLRWADVRRRRGSASLVQSSLGGQAVAWWSH